MAFWVWPLFLFYFLFIFLDRGLGYARRFLKRLKEANYEYILEHILRCTVSIFNKKWKLVLAYSSSFNVHVDLIVVSFFKSYYGLPSWTITIVERFTSSSSSKTILFGQCHKNCFRQHFMNTLLRDLFVYPWAWAADDITICYSETSLSHAAALMGKQDLLLRSSKPAYLSAWRAGGPWP